MRTTPNASKNRQPKPYERPATSTNTGGNNHKGILSQVKDTVSELFNHPWIPSFLRYDSVSDSNNQTTSSNAAELVNESSVQVPSTSNLQINQIYPEEGNIPGPSTSNAGWPMMAFKLNNTDKYKAHLLRAEPLVSSTPSSSPNIMERAVGAMDTPTNQSADVSIITPNFSSQMDIEEPSTSQKTPLQSATNRSTVTKKRLRDSFNDSSNSSFQNRSMPQTSALSSKRPRFNASTYGSPVNTSSALAESSFSIFYPGKTMYGGAANYKKPKCLSPLKSLQRAQVTAQSAPEPPEEEAGLSIAAKRILTCLDKMSTPLSEAKKMPFEKGKLTYFDSPYISDFHKHRPSLRTESPRTPPTRNLLTPAKTTTKENLASFLRKSGTPDSISAPGAPVAERPSAVTTLPSAKASDEITFNKKSLVVTSEKLEAPKMDKPSSEKRKMTGIKSTQDSFKITSKKGIPQFDDSPIEVPRLPNISLPVTGLPTISFSSNFKPPASEVKSKVTVSPSRPTFTTPVSGSFSFSNPEILRDAGSKSNDAHVNTAFVFSKPHSEKDTLGLTAKTLEPSKSPKFGSTTLNNKISSIYTNGTVSSSWGDKFKPATDSWECGSCCIRNQNSDSKCVACQTPNLKSTTKPFAIVSKPAFSLGSDLVKSSLAEEPFKLPASLPQEARVPPQVNGFGAMFGKKDGQWTCNVCMVDNNKDSDSCVACMTPKSGASTGSLGDKKSTVVGFGSMFSVAKCDWECDVCLVRNKESDKKCVACGSLNPSIKNIDPTSDEVATGFTFGVPSQTSDGSGKMNSMPTFAPGITTASTGSFNFGAKSTSTQPTTTFKFGAEKTSPAKSSGAAFTFGAGTQAVKSSPDEVHNITSKTVSASSDFSFGSNSSSVVTTKPDFQFGANTKLSETTTSNFTFGTKRTLEETAKAKLGNFSNIVQSTTTVTTPVESPKLLNSVPKLSPFEGVSNSSEKKLPFDVFKKPAPVFDANVSSKTSQPLSAEGTKKPSVVPPEGGLSKTGGFNLEGNSDKIVNKSNMFTFGGSKDKSTNGFNFTPKLIGSDSSTTSNALDLFSNKNIDKPAKVAAASTNSIFAPKDSLSNNIGNTAPQMDSGSSISSPNMFGFKSPAISEPSVNMFSGAPNPLLSTSKPAESVAAPAAPSSNFSFGDGTKMSSTNNAVFNFGQEIQKPNLFTFGSDAPKESNKRANTGFNFGQSPAPAAAPSTLNFSFGQKAKPEEKEGAPSAVFTFGNSNPPQDTNKSLGFFGQQANESSTNLNNNFSFAKPADAFNQIQPSFSIGQANGDTSSPMSAFGSPVNNPFNTTGSGVGPTKTSRIIKKAVRRTRK